MVTMKRALTIAGSDPTGGAGLQADLRVFHRLGVYGLSVVAALTAQNTTGVEATQAVESVFVERQLTALLNDIRPDALKTGMLHSREIILAVVRAIKGFDLDNLVIDPVTVSSSGKTLLDPGGLQALKDELLPLARVITPNIYEAVALTGHKIGGESDMKETAMRLWELGAEAVIVTGGHLKGETVDVMYDGRTFHYLRGKKLPGEYHGTGCAFSAALTAHLARGLTPISAAEKAKEFMNEAISKAHSLGKGMKILNV
jgi:hydroxymethylpyrimidine/phosphomethylpyrimidine kinase